jgi:Domain of unknown function (DUF4411)
MTYVLVANEFMEASRLYHGFDLARGFWKWLQGSDLNGKVASVKSVNANYLRHRRFGGMGKLPACVILDGRHGSFDRRIG